LPTVTEYDAAGRKTKTLYSDLAAQLPDTHYAYAVEGTGSTYSAPGAATLTTLHTFCDAAGRLLSRVEFRYDADGHLIEEAQTSTAEMLPPGMLASLNPAQLETVHAVRRGRRAQAGDASIR
jgi:hypothetical protein